MTLGALGGAEKPLTEAELLELPPLIDLATLGRAVGISAPVIRDMNRSGKLADLGIRVLPFGRQYRVPKADVLRVMGIEPPGGADAA